MSTKVTLTIPDHIYKQVEQVAQTNEQPLADVINEALAEAFPTVHINPQRQVMEREQEAFKTMLPELLKNYEFQYVAVHNGQVVDHDNDKINLVARIEQSFPEKVVLIKQVTSKPDRVIHMRSPRFIE
jgi:Family of unknown function (DUF5678)